MSHLFEIEPETPRWVLLKQKHEIRVDYHKSSDEVAAIYGDFYETARTEREAVVALLHSLRLDGWETVSIEP